MRILKKRTRCAALNCTNTRDEYPELSFFTFPKDEERCRLWIKNTGNDELIIQTVRHRQLCALHFEDSQFVNSNKKRLLWSAVPTLFHGEDRKEAVIRNAVLYEAPSTRSKRRRLIKEKPSVEVKQVEGLPAVEVERELSEDTCSTMEVAALRRKEKPCTNDTVGDKRMDTASMLSCVKTELVEEEELYMLHESDISGEEMEDLHLDEPVFVDMGLLCANVKEEMVFEDENIEDSPVIDYDDNENNDQYFESEVDPFPSHLTAYFVEGPLLLEGQEVLENQSYLEDLPLLKRRDSTGSKVLGKEMEELMHMNWLRQEKAKVEQHILEVRQQKQLKERCGNDEQLLQQRAKFEQNILTVHQQKQHVKRMKFKPLAFKVVRTYKKIDVEKQLSLSNNERKGDGVIGQMLSGRSSCIRLDRSHSRHCKCNSCSEEQPAEEFMIHKGTRGSSQKVHLMGFQTNSHISKNTKREMSKSVEKTTMKQANISKCLQIRTPKDGVSLLRYLCSQCSEVFTNSSAQFQHVRSCIRKTALNLNSTPLKRVKTLLYSCALCNERFHSEAAGAKHVLNCYQNRPYFCCACGKRFETSKSRAIHVSTRHNGESKYICMQCGHEFTERRAMKRHQDLHFKDDMLTYHCSVCKKDFDNKSSRVDHAVEHVWKELFTCCSCGLRFSSCNELENHIVIHLDDKPVVKVKKNSLLIVNNKDNSFLCNLCGTSFHNRSLFEKHKSEKKCQPNCVVSNCCPVCNEKFENVDDKMNHINSLHVKRVHKGCYFCCVCNSIFQSYLEIISHMKTHTQSKKSNSSEREKQIQHKVCVNKNIKPGTKFELLHLKRTEANNIEGCSSVVSRKESNKPTVLVVNEKPPEQYIQMPFVCELGRNSPYSCYVCGQKFLDLSARAEHVRMHVGEERFSCSFCGKKFTVKTNLDRHLTTHFTQEGTEIETSPFICSICAKLFFTVDARLEHMKIHVGELTCDTCGKFYATKGNLKRHIHTHT